MRPNRLPGATWAWLAALLLSIPTTPVAAQDGARGTSTTLGPAKGALVIAGGGRLGSDIMNRFVELAGGADARIVVIPTAGEQDEYPDDWAGLRPLREAGARNITVLHTRDPRVADTERFASPLRTATGVWIAGGRQWRLADTYLGTRTLRELLGVLERGGVVGGSSAGASIQPSYMVRGAPEGNHIMMARGHEQGFGLLSNAAVDQHLLARNRQNDLLEVVRAHPELLGIGLDEGTAVVVRADRAEVLGRSLVAFYNAADADGHAYYFLENGDVFDLGARRVLEGERLPPAAADERAVVATVQRLFDAMRAADSAAVRRLFHPQARLLVPGAAEGRPAVSVTSLEEFVLAVANSNRRYDERMRDPEVRVDAHLATLWAPYEFHLAGELSHCGIDAFQLARSAEGWQILQVAYTRRTACR
jgi:cyanophycinase